MLQPALEEATIKLDPVALLTHASWPVKMTTLVLIIATLMVWVIAALKYLQLSRLQGASRKFEGKAVRVQSSAELYDLASNGDRDAPGVRVVLTLYSRGGGLSVERLRAAADRAIVAEKQRAKVLMAPLASIAAAAPFVGLFGTVYGIMDAFVRIGAAKSAALPVVAPAIGEALLTTAIGLGAAIPAVVFFNFVDKRVSDLLSELEASAAEWVTIISGTSFEQPIPLTQAQQAYDPYGGRR